MVIVPTGQYGDSSRNIARLMQLVDLLIDSSTRPTSLASVARKLLLLGTMRSANFAFYLFSIGLVLLGVVFAADALVVTDTERLETFVEAMTGEVSDQRVEAGLHYLRPDVEPVQLRIGTQLETFEAGMQSELGQRIRDALATLQGAKVTLIQKAIELHGTQARVALRARLSSAEAFNLLFVLVRHGESWTVRSVRIS